MKPGVAAVVAVAAIFAADIVGMILVAQTTPARIIAIPTVVALEVFFVYSALRLVT